MDYHDAVDPVPNETCNGIAAADVLAQEFLSAPPHMLNSDPENRHRLLPQLPAIVQKQRAIENAHQSVAYGLSEAVELLFWQSDPSKAVKASDEVRQLLLQPNFAHDFAMAVADFAVTGGSLGGNLSLRLGERTQPFWVSTVVPWSPASVWDPYPSSFELDFPDLLKPFKYIAVDTAGDNAKNAETDSSRKEYFKGVFDNPTTPNELLPRRWPVCASSRTGCR